MRWGRVLVFAATVVFVAAEVVRAFLAYGPASVGTPAGWAISTALLLPCLLLGWLIAVRAPASPIGPALALTATTPAVVFTVEDWGTTYLTAHPWPGARVVDAIGTGAWPWLFLGFVTLILLFPDGLLPGRRWQVIWAAVPAAAALVNFTVSTDGGNMLPRPFRVALTVVAFTLLIAVLLAAASSLVVRYRHGDQLTRLRLRWLLCAAVSVPGLLAASWLAVALGAPGAVAYTGFLVAMLVLVPATIAVAILKHDLLDIDQLLGTTLSWLITAATSAAIFAAGVLAAGNFFPDRVSVTTAAFVTALALLPLHQWVHRTVGRFVDPDRTVVLTRIRSFVRQVRDGEAEPEQVENVLRDALDDPLLRVLLRRPGDQFDIPPGAIPLRTGESIVGALILGTTSARRIRRAREAAVEARLPLEVSRLRLELREALDEVRASRFRLMEEVNAERRRLERDLHDGAQQQLIAIGMRLRSLQYQLEPGLPAYREIDEAVEAVEGTVAELRRIAHGVRPSRLDDGLAVALRRLVADSSVPVDLVVPELEIGEGVATAVYYTVGEAIANALKHASATRISIEVGMVEQRLQVAVRDNGVGGAKEGFGLTSLRDRVASVGGEITVDSPPGAGTSIRVEIPCAS
ncbi:sensor histidine kinase [Kribbella sp. NBC_01245]|uniref:sensor histidine kinase n=1 Tax=Kribbella sp. NBC_01245 TaxID=2903578 RepID=UPI002E2E6173|nr:sensor histidine kinase [Kribbella sp. NBC_01245]